MLSWYIITLAIGVLFIPFAVLGVIYLLWETKKLVRRIENKWDGVKLGGSSDRMAAVRLPGSGKMLELKIGGTVSSTSSVHPTKETWLNIQASSKILSNGTERMTMRDFQDMFDKVPQNPSQKEEGKGKDEKGEREDQKHSTA